MARERARAQYEYFRCEGNPVFMENAGGSQAPDCVINAMCNYMRTCYVQLGAGYELSNTATGIVDKAHKEMLTFMGGESSGEVILGASTTQLLFMLSHTYAKTLLPGDEIVLHVAAHEANFGPWSQLEVHGASIRVWEDLDDDYTSVPETLVPLLNDKTRLVCLVHVSNLLGAILDVKSVAQLVRLHAPRAHLIVDGVAYAPHRAICFDEWDVDHYVFSTYKVFGPHMGALCSRKTALQQLSGPNHFFIPDHIPYKFELGGACHEGCAGLIALKYYLRALLGQPPDSKRDLQREEVLSAFELITQMELPLQESLIEYLQGKNPQITLVGPRSADPQQRVSTISFTHQTVLPSAIAKRLQERNFAVRNGHMYAYRLVEMLQLSSIEEGVVRLSLLHYNTPAEVELLKLALTEVLSDEFVDPR